MNITYSSTLLPSENTVVEIRKGLLDLLQKVNMVAVPKFGDVNQGDYSEFETDGTLKFNGEAVVWKDIITPADNNKPGAGGAAPTWAAFMGGIYAYRFDAGSAQELYGSMEMQHDYKEGTDIEFHVHWSPTTAGAGNVVLGLEYTLARRNSVFPSSTTVTMMPTATPGVANTHVANNIAVIPGGGISIGTVMAYRIYRQNGGTDTYAGNVFMHSIGVHYQVDTVGSRATFTK